jgi:hypothetical protein
MERLRQWLLVSVAALAFSAPLGAQCAMCRASADYQRAEAINALRRGIVVLAIPPTAIALGIFWLTYKYRGTSDDHKDRDDET